MLNSKLTSTLFLLLLMYAKSSYQANLAAKAELQLSYGMSITTYFTELPANELVYEIWFNNPHDYPYWKNAICLAVLAGTPGLSDPNDDHCSFLPVVDSRGRKNPYEPSGDACIQEPVTINPCRDGIKLNRQADCGSNLNLLPQYYTLTDSHYTGLTKLVSKKYRNVWLNPDRKESVYRQSMLVSYTDRNNSISEWKQTLKCKNLNLGSGPMEDFTFYSINSDGTYDTKSFSSGAVLIQINASIALGAIFVACLNFLFNKNH